ncbi:SCP1.201-like deaminase [Solwaraspora sp. WMMD1047]|uniref:DddA-like double-stranded DNA deaminase toxin n=1 Tax=Solwaraspora sp. WMMD1047 TaxID=3016102 RepID=UPI00241809FF|nr:DddA-like double-stranded DNA deaminase toxin [Solwaraspora sp. WMMD1047]MDG4834114.1 SCP1.201-like deaminase [Solwaraspora sp. WMMD1047]
MADNETTAGADPTTTRAAGAELPVEPMVRIGVRLRAAVADVRAAAATANQVARRLTETAARLQEHLRGAAGPSVDHLSTALRVATARARQGAASARAGADAVEAYMTSIGVPLKAQSPPPKPGGVAGTPTFPAGVAAAAAILRSLLPRGSKVAGMLLSPDGRTRSKPIWSGGDGPGAGAPGLRRDSALRWHQMAAATQHVEGHAAAILRRPAAPAEAILVVSAPPCGGPKGCHRRLAEMLPVGTTLRVYVAGDGDTPTWWADYHGNGRGTT